MAESLLLIEMTQIIPVLTNPFTEVNFYTMHNILFVLCFLKAEYIEQSRLPFINSHVE